MNRLLWPYSVRHLSVTIAAQRRLLTGDDTRHDGPPSRANPSSRAVFPGGGRCWVRTNVG